MEKSREQRADDLSPHYAELEAILRGGGIDPERDADLLHAIARDVGFRAEMGAEAAGRRGRGVRRRANLRAGCLVIGEVCVGGAVMSALLPVEIALPMFLITALGLAAVLVVAARREREIKDRDAAAWCVRCGYDLSTLPDAAPAAALAGRNIGPVACPECGMRWPRVARVGKSS